MYRGTYPNEIFMASLNIYMHFSFPGVYRRYFGGLRIWEFETGVASTSLLQLSLTRIVLCVSKWLCQPEPKRFISATARFHLLRPLIVSRPTRCHFQWLSDRAPPFICISSGAAQCRPCLRISASSRAANMWQRRKIHRRRWADESWQVTHTADAVAH